MNDNGRHFPDLVSMARSADPNTRLRAACILCMQVAHGEYADTIFSPTLLGLADTEADPVVKWTLVNAAEAQRIIEEMARRYGTG